MNNFNLPKIMKFQRQILVVSKSKILLIAVIRLFMDFHNFFISYVFEVKESISGSFSKLSCSGDLENPGQLPVLHVLEGILMIGSHGFF